VRHVVKRCTDVLERMIKGAMAKEAEGTRFRKNRRARQREGKGRREGGTRGFVGQEASAGAWQRFLAGGFEALRLLTAVFWASRGFIWRIRRAARSPLGRGQLAVDAEAEEVSNFHHKGFETTAMESAQTTTVREPVSTSTTSQLGEL
jgi:hypothetical protein